MSLIATCVERTGVVRIFFDMRPAESSREDERRIATAIETALNLAEAEAKQAPHDHMSSRSSSDLTVESTL